MDDIGSASHGRFGRRSALRSEWIYGSGYQGPASDRVFSLLTGLVRWRDGMCVLDLGSGLGGDTMRLARELACSVVGLDRSADMSRLCTERLSLHPATNVEFRTGTLQEVRYAPRTFDLIWTRDCGMYMPTEEKRVTWHVAHGIIALDGQILITDYCRGDGPSSDEFRGHVVENEQHLGTAEEYEGILTDAGFTDVAIIDITHELLRSLKEELEGFVLRRVAFCQEFSVEDFDYMVDRWRAKIRFCERRELLWLAVTARR
jgi:phosphoethanolamine N-methyltransferase